ncbi:MAG: ferredoxin--NADP reductase [Caulobacteraceae bacterium]
MTQTALADRPIPAHLFSAPVLDVTHYTEKLFAFSCARPPALRFRAGEFVMIGLMVGEKPLLRAYSIASPTWDDVLSFYSIKVPDGPLTTRLQHIKPGDDILVGRKPTGTLVLDALRPGVRLFLIATGTGLAPFASLVREPDTYARYDEVILTHTCRVDRELEYGREVVAAARADLLVGDLACARLRYVTTLTRAPHPIQGRITNLIADGVLFADLNAPALNPERDRIMICGAAPVLRDMKAIALAAGFDEGSNHHPGGFVIERAFAS